ncbi:MAG: hypothetical protein E7431_05330 [Ruminococcaceae bacterium]|nr:hypothetical protein [Oscillospiraceae bacterium]
MERVSRLRAWLLLMFFLLVLVLFSARLYKLQIVDTKGDTDNTEVFTTLTRVKAARGDILDRNGNILIGNRASYDLVFNHYVITSADNTNNHLLRLVNKCRELGIEYIDHFPVTKERPFEYTIDDYTTAWRGYFQSYLYERSMDSDITAPLLVETLKARYKIPAEWSDADARAVVGMRYEFDLRGVVNLPTYTFLEDVSDEDLSALLELNIPGLMVESSTVREYYTPYAAHILGTMGAMTKEQWDKVDYAQQYEGGPKYYMDAQVGQSGFEAAFEQYLHGEDGMRIDNVDKTGAIISQEYRKGDEPRAGNNVETTIDINLQIVAEDALADQIAYLQDPTRNTSGDGNDVEGAAVVVMKVKTGEILACASYPTYNLQTYNDEYEEILKQDFDPLFNRAFHASYPPGSTYKMCTLVAAMEAGLVTSDEIIKDGGIYLEYKEDYFTPTCLIWSNYGYTHGELVAWQALMVSCNYYFYELGNRLATTTGGKKALDDTAKGLGLGEPTGIELNEDIGHRANEETKKMLYTGNKAGFYVGNVILAAIGQDENKFSPLQLCVYASTLANQGVRMRATFLNRVVSSDYRSLVYENEPEIMSELKISDATYNAYVEGMVNVISGGRGTARETMKGLGVTVAGKTGTAQTGMLGSDHGAFICFAPAEDPEIAIAVYGEKAAHGATLGLCAKAIIQYYFENNERAGSVAAYENTLG